jgi:Methyltransferase domain
MQIKHRIELVKLLPHNSICAEVGVAEANFSCDLLDAGVGILYSVDYWQKIDGVVGDGNFDQSFHDNNYNTAVERLNKYGYRSFIIKSKSVDAAAKLPNLYLDMVYLDAAHYYTGIYADLVAWYPKVGSGGIIAGHDYLCTDYQVKEAVADFIEQNSIQTTVNVIPENNINDASFYFIKP